MKKLVVFYLMLTFAVIAMAQVPTDLTVKAPGWIGMAVQKDRSTVTIRKSPSTTAPKQMGNYCNVKEIYGFTVVNKEWSDRSVTKDVGCWEAVPFESWCPVIRKQNMWYEIAEQVNGYLRGWVPANQCTFVSFHPLTPKDFSDSDREICLDGEYEGFIIGRSSLSERDSYVLKIGKIDNGILVFAYEIKFAARKKKTGNITINKMGNSYVLTYPVSADDWEWWEPSDIDIRKFSSEQIAFILQNAKPIARGYIDCVVQYLSGRNVYNVSEEVVKE